MDEKRALDRRILVLISSSRSGVVVSYQCWEYDAVRGIDRPAIKLKADREHPHRPGLSSGWTRSAAAPT